jgi:hypothetical protein
MLADEAIDHRGEKADVVDVLGVGRVGPRLAAVVPVALEAVGIDRQEAVTLRQLVEHIGVAAARLLPVAHRAVEDEDECGRRQGLGGEVGVPGPGVPPVLERAGDQRAGKGGRARALHPKSPHPEPDESREDECGSNRDSPHPRLLPKGS